MAQIKELVKSYFDQKGLKYTQHEKGFITVDYSLSNIKSLTILLSIDEEDAKVELFSNSIGKFEQDKFAQGLLACNTCNTQYRWVKFYIDDDNEVCIRADAILDEATCGKECLEVVERMAIIINEAYPAFMKARWA